MRLGLAAVGGYLAEALTTDWFTGVTIGMVVYLLSYYLARFTWYKGADRESMGKVFTTGVGGFILVFLFTWMILFTLQIAGYSV